MEMRAEAIAGVVSNTQNGSRLNNLALTHQWLLQVRVNRLIPVPVQDTHVNTIVVTGWLFVNSKDFPRGYAKYFAAGWGSDVQAIMTRQAELGIISWIRPKVLRNYAKLCGPDFKFEITHSGFRFDCKYYFKIMSSSLTQFWAPGNCNMINFASTASRSRI